MKRTAALSPDVQSGKAAFGGLVKAFGGQEAVAAETGVRRQAVSDMGLANVDYHPPLWLIDVLEARTVGTLGAPHVTEWLCRRRGGVFVPIPAGDDAGEGLGLAVVELSEELGELAGSVRSALCAKSPGGRQTVSAERREIRDDIYRMQQTLAALDAELLRLDGLEATP